MAKLSLNSVATDVFRVKVNETEDHSEARADIVAEGRLLAYEYARKGQEAYAKAFNTIVADPDKKLSSNEYKQLNETFQAELMLYAANKVAQFSGEAAPTSFEDFKKSSMKYYGNAHFYAVLQGIFQEIVTPILPAVYSEAVGVFADVVEVGFGETYAISIGSNDIPVFQDSAWGASRSVPRNRFYSKDYTLNPQPKSCWITAKWIQLIGNGMDFGRFFANLTAGMYAKTMGMWNAAMTAAIANTSLVPTALTQTFSDINWITLANKLAAVNNTTISNIIAYGNAVALAKVLPTDTTGSTNVDMDAAIATLLGADYMRAGYIGEFLSVRLMPLMDAIIPGTQNTTVDTILDPTTIYLMAGNGRKPMTIAYNSNTPITIEMDPTKTGDFEIGINMTIALDSVATFASKVGVITI